MGFQEARRKKGRSQRVIIDGQNLALHVMNPGHQIWRTQNF